MKRRIFSVLRSAKHAIVNTPAEPITDVTIETTTYCNRRCSYCPNSVFERGLKKNEHLMAPSLFRKIVDELADIGFKGNLSPHGYGEPLTDPRLISFMHYAHSRLPEATLLLYTNGDFLTPTLLDKLYDAGVSDYRITSHSTDDASLTDSVNRISQLKNHAKDQNKDITIQCLFPRELPLCNRGGLLEVNQRGPLMCEFADWPVTINYRGDVLSCCNDYLGQVVFGNLCHESLEDMWLKPDFLRLRHQIKKQVYTLDICKKCTRT